MRFSLGVSSKDRIRNNYIRGTGKVGLLGGKVREVRLGWFDHVLRSDVQYIGRRLLRTELPGKRKRGRIKRRFMDEVREGMQEVGVIEEVAEDRMNWKMVIHCSDPENRSLFSLTVN